MSFLLNFINKVKNIRITGSTGAAVVAPSGWATSRPSTGVYRITHNLGHSNYSIFVTLQGGAGLFLAPSFMNKGAAFVEIVLYSSASAAANLSSGVLDVTLVLD